MDKLDEGIWQIKGLLSLEDCAALILQAELTGFQVARLHSLGRHNREVFLHWQEASEEIITKLNQAMPENFQVAGLGRTLECYCYQEGEFVSPHRDTSQKISGNLWSNLTLVIYLNDEFRGGETVFPQRRVTVTPEPGKAILFEHSILHEGSVVFEGLKYIIRTDTALFNRH